MHILDHPHDEGQIADLKTGTDEIQYHSKILPQNNCKIGRELASYDYELLRLHLQKDLRGKFYV